jgi:hypothetical protein
MVTGYRFCYDCAACAYTAAGAALDAVCPCLSFSFGGVQYHDVGLWVRLTGHSLGYYPPPGLRGVGVSPRLKLVKTWAHGHLEWAWDVLNRPDEGSYRSRCPADPQ